MKSATTWLGIMGGVAMVLALSKGVRGAVMVGILFVTFISWIPDHKASYLGANSPVDGERCWHRC
jgi:AGZA family xanthine/uracil permease-like MFS transporter